MMGVTPLTFASVIGSLTCSEREGEGAGERKGKASGAGEERERGESVQVRSCLAFKCPLWVGACASVIRSWGSRVSSVLLRV
jgi:hypothetical protein